MKLVYGWHARVLSAFGVLVFASIAALARGEEMSIDEASKAIIEGIYILQEWHRNGEILRPPLVDARFVLLNGRFMFISDDRTKEPNRKTVAGYGVYLLEPGKFSYRYEGFSVVTQTADGTSVSEKLPWEGLRMFSANSENNEVRFRAMNGPQEYWFNASGLSYSDGTQLRVFQRITGK